MSQSPTVRAGELAPDFTLPDANGRPVSLSEFRGKAEVVLFFYPKDNSPGCSAEACSFRDQFEVFREAGAEVIGISADDSASHRDFAARHRLPFWLLTDADGLVTTRYKVAKTLGLIPGRVTFLIDRAGVIRHRFSSQFRLTRHVAEALRVLEELRDRQPTSPG